MSIEKFALGQTPHLIVACTGNLEVRGYDRDDTRVESDTMSPDITEIEGGIRVDCTTNCIIRMPRGGSLFVEQANGTFRIKDIAGSIEVGSISGSATVRRVTSIHIAQAASDVQVRGVAEGVSLGQVSGSLSLRDIGGPIAVGNVFGDLLGRTIPEGIICEGVSGEIVLRTNFNPGAESLLNSMSTIKVSIPAESSMRFILPPGLVPNVSGRAETVMEGEQRIVQFGEGEALIQINQADEVIIRQSREETTDSAFAYSFAAGEQLSEDLANLSSEMETQFAMIEANLAHSVSERVQKHVEKRLSIARRQVEAAQRRVEQEATRAEHLAHGISVTIDGVPGERPQEPVTEAERLVILKMLEEGKIDVQQAEELLAALEGNS